MKIYIFTEIVYSNGEIVVAALAEDGTYLASHYCSDEGFIAHDMGLTSNWKHDAYRRHYPDGYELVYLSDPMSDAGFVQAIERNSQYTEFQTEDLDSKNEG